MNFIIPSDTANMSAQVRRVHWNKKKHYELGWLFGWFLYNHSTVAFVEGMRNFLDAPEEIKNQRLTKRPQDAVAN